MRSILSFLDGLEELAASYRPKAPGLSSQAAQIKPLSPSAIALGKKPYLGPKRPRPIKRKRN